MRRKIFVFLFVFLFVCFGNREILAEGASCSVFRNKLVGREVIADIKPTEISDGSSICISTGKKFDFFTEKEYDGTAKITCNDGSPSTKNCPDRYACDEESGGGNKYTANCIVGSVNCDAPNNIYYYNAVGDYARVADEDKINVDQTICFGKEIKICTNKNGTWDGTGTTCTQNQSCVIHQKLAGLALYAKCEDMCTHPVTRIKMIDRDIYCDESTRIIKRCENSSWKEVSFKDALGSDCPSGQCVETNSGPRCNTGSFCSTITIENQEYDVKDSVDTQQICYQDQVYTCNGNKYVPGLDCKKNKDEKEKYCSSFLDGTAKCGPKSADGSIESQIEISTTPVDKFWCGSDHTKINTAIGCLPITIGGLVDALLPTIFGIAGGIAFLMMVYGFVMISTSSGDEKKMQAAKQIVTSAITGLLVAIFALFLYKLIAVDILHIPGFLK